MSIQDFYSALSSRNENNDLLFDALRRLRRMKHVQSLLFADETLAGGWYPWDGVAVQQPVDVTV
jgi:hypothetical protein